MKSNYLLILPFLFCISCFGQDVLENNFLIELLETNIETDESNVDFNTLLELYQDLYDHPIDINKATQQDLIESGLLSLAQAQELIAYRNEYGAFLEKNEVTALESISAKEAKFISYFITISSNYDTNHPFSDGKHQIITRYTRTLEQQDGFRNGNYLGSPDKHYLRYRYNAPSGSSFGLTLEKDAGERLGFSETSNRLGYDYLSYHLFIKPHYSNYSIALGDYILQFGQGLHFWNGFALNKSMYATDISKYGTELRPYTSVNESLNLRGAAVSFGQKWNTTVFVSTKDIDGNTVSDDEFSSFQTSGLHRTTNELEDKGSVKETILGSRLSYRGEQIKIGATTSQTLFSSSLNKGDEYYNQFHFSGDRYFTTSVDYHYFKNKIEAFGETSLLWGNDLATLNGIKYNHSPKHQFVISHRHYGKSYFSRYTNAFSEGSLPTNENGIYLGGNVIINSKWSAAAYADFYQFPWLRFQASAPATNGSDYQSQINYRPNHKINMYIRFKYELKDENASSTDLGYTPITKIIAQRYTYRVRYHLNTSFSDRLSLRTRVEVSDVSIFTSERNLRQGYGFLAYQDISYGFFKYNRLKVAARYALFNTESFDTRIYTYESDVLYSFSVPAYFNRGSRMYLMLKYRLNRNLDFWVRYARFDYFDQETISSGNNEIDTNHKSEIKFQLSLKI